MTPSETPATPAAVLVPVHRDGRGNLRLILVRRGEGGQHGGHLALPGGKPDPGDASLRDTALRETWEEIGLPRERIQVLADLPPITTQSSGFLIHPFLARVHPPPQWLRQEREIAEILDVRIDDLLHPQAHGETVKHFPSWPQPRRVPFYRVGEYQLWGATYRILHPLLPRLQAGEWPL